MPNNNENRDNRRGRWQGFDLGGSGNSAGPANRNRFRFLLAYVALGLLILFIIRGALQPQATIVPLNTFFTQLQENKIEKVQLAGDSITWTTRDGGFRKATLPVNYDPTNLVSQLAKAHVPTEATQPSQLTGFLLQWLLPLAFLAGIWFF